MRSEHLSLLRCPDCRAALVPADFRLDSVGHGGEVERGRLDCPACRTAFPIVEGIPSLLPQELREGDRARNEATSQMRREMALRDEESRCYDRLYDDLAYRFELETYVRRLALSGGERVLDVGCGTGRVTKEYLGSAALVVAADFSQDSLVYFRTRTTDEQRRRLLLVRCEVGHLPLPDAAFDAAVSTSLFSNVPTAATRDAGLAEVHRALRPGARFLVTVYNHSLLKRVRQRLGLSRSGAKQGLHSGGRVHYYNFDPAEFRMWVAQCFEPGRCFGLNHRVPLLSRSSGRLAGSLDRILYRVPGSLGVFAKEMGMLARKAG